MRAHFLQYIFLFLLGHNSEFLENLIKSYCTRPHFSTQWVLNGLVKALVNIVQNKNLRCMAQYVSL